MYQTIFIVLSVLAILGALGVITSRNPMHSVLCLIFTFFMISAHYILLNAQFIALVNVIVYAGAIMVLFLFVVMLLNLNKDTEPHKSDLVKIVGSVAAGLLMITLMGALRGTTLQGTPGMMDTEIGLVQNLGNVLFKDFLAPFELSAVLFLAAMVGAVLLGKKNIEA